MNDFLKSLPDSPLLPADTLADLMTARISEEQKAALFAGGEDLVINEPNRKTMVRLLTRKAGSSPNLNVKTEEAKAMVTRLSAYLDEYMADQPEAHVWIIFACLFSAFIAGEPLHPQEMARWEKDEATGTCRCGFREDVPGSTCRWCVCVYDEDLRRRLTENTP